MHTPLDARTDDGGWRRPHETAYRLRTALLALGIPPTELDALTARRDASDTDRIIIPPLTLAATDRLLTALGPYLGPQRPGTRDAAPSAIGHP
jgi:hypothetical protein